jgi:hypothetical protein
MNIRLDFLYGYIRKNKLIASSRFTSHADIKKAGIGDK